LNPELEITKIGTKGSILIVDDVPTNVQLLAELLNSQGYGVRATTSPKQALELLAEGLPDLVLLDVNMPEMSGYEVCRRIKADPKLRDVPVLFISAMHDLSDKIQGFEAGGVDYITKPFQTREVVARIDAHIQIAHQRREIQALREKEVAYLRHVNQLQDDLLRMASHDLKNPLGMLIGYLDVFTHSLEDRQVELIEDEKDCLDAISRNADRMLRLVHDLLDLSQAESEIPMECAWVSASEYLKESLSNFTLVAQQKQVNLVFVQPQPDFMLYLAPERFAHVMDNLLSNGIKYTPEGGTVKVSAESITDESLGHYAIIRIADTGLGIPEEAIPHLFEKFYRVNRPEHRAQPGTGLGMAIVKTVVEQHQGRISVESTLGQGTTITVLLPLNKNY